LADDFYSIIINVVKKSPSDKDGLFNELI